MAQRLIFVVEVENDQDVPAVGATFDLENNLWTFLDVRLDRIEKCDEDHTTKT